MRDLQKDLAICNKATSGPWKSVRAAYEDCLVLNDEYSLSKHDIKFITTSREGWPHAIGRAIKAEAEVERLKLMVKSITGGLDEAIETNHYLEKIIDGLNADLQMVATDESTEGYPCICSICELACKCPDEKRDPYSNKDSLCKFVWRGLKDGHI